MAAEGGYGIVWTWVRHKTAPTTPCGMYISTFWNAGIREFVFDGVSDSEANLETHDSDAR